MLDLQVHMEGGHTYASEALLSLVELNVLEKQSAQGNFSARLI